MPSLKIMISGGGTGGHIFPALAIAEQLKRMQPEAEFHFVGALGRMEMERVPQAGYSITGLWISGLQRKLSAGNLLFPLKVLHSLWRCRKLLRQFKPHAVIGTGGFASGPLLYAASSRGIPCLIQEQNSYPGITNKILAKRVQKIAVAYPGMERFFPAEKIVLTGNPIREKIRKLNPDREQALRHFGLDPARSTILVLGGSLGARRINELLALNLDALLRKDINLLWQCGKLYYQELEQSLGHRQNDQFQLRPFISNMEQALAADLVISRAGAGTLSELAVAGKAVMLIPSPNVAEDHQTKNARTLESDNAAILFDESGSNQEFLTAVDRLQKEQSRLRENIQAHARPHAAEDIAREVLKLTGS